MEYRSVIRALLLLIVIAAPLRAQDSDESAFFSLSSDRTYKTGVKPAIHLYSTGVKSLEFRVYRVNDPLEFFKNLEDAHSFGGRAPKVPQGLTLVERFHQFKRDMRFRIVNMFRAQYTKETRATIRERMNPPAPQPAKAKLTPAGPGIEMYPNIPLLNDQQVVAVWQQPIGDVRRWDQQTISFDVPGKGVYLVEATDGDLRAYTISIVTDIAAITKVSGGKVVTFIADRETGKPIADSQVWMLLKGQAIGEGRADANGILDRTVDQASTDSLLVLARRGDDYAVSSEFGWAANGNDRNLMGYIYSERPIYRPTHTVYFKGILRQAIAERYELPARRVVDVDIEGPDGNSVFRRPFPISPNGTIHGEYALPAAAGLGTYSIVARAGENEIRGNFEVEEYKKPEYDVRVTPDKARVVQGEEITALVEARYFFGEPVSNADVKYVVHTSPYYYFPRDEEFDEFSSDEGEYDYGGDQIDEQTAKPDADGKFRITIPTSVMDSNQRWTRDVRYRIEARVTDQGNREITGHGFVIATYGSFTLQLSSDRYVHEVGAAAKLIVNVQDYDKKPIQTDVEIALTQWRPYGRDEAVLFQQFVKSGADGRAEVSIPVTEAGSFRVRATAKTPEGREVEDTYYLWMTGTSTAWADYEMSERIRIVPDKSSYAPGETATVLILTGVPEAHVLITTEGRSLKAPRIVHATSPSFTIDVPIVADSAPNFFVGAVFLRDNQLHQGTKSLKVPPLERQLTIDVQPSKPEFKPAEPAVYTVTTKDFAGKPVAAEVSFGLVDEAIYGIRPEAASDIVKFFYGTTYNRVYTQSSLSYYFHGSAGKRAMRLAELRPSARAQLKPEKLVEAKVRKAFPDTAIWVADVKTDNAGKATVKVDFPDALTTWRATARAVTSDTRVGSTVQKTIVRKNLILRLVVPRFFTLGDDVTVSVLVHNYLQNEKTARISLAATGLQVLEGATKDIAIPSRGEVRVDWKVKATSIANVQILGKALTDEESDAMELTLPVIPFGVKLSTSAAGSISGSSDVNNTVTFPKNIDPASRSLDIGVSPSIAGAIFGALDYLTAFPYGCTEQTMSSFLPNIVVKNALKELNVKSNVDDEALAKKIREGLMRLYDFQHPDGGWGWWQTDDSAEFMTAYVVSGLAQARDAGVTIETPRLDAATNWLGQRFDAQPRAVPDFRAYMLYALSFAGKASGERVEAVWNQRAELSPYGLALLGILLDRAGDSRAMDIVNTLEGSAKVDEREAYWSVLQDPLMQFYGDTSPEATAFALKLLVKKKPDSPLLPKAALWLVNHRNEGYYWTTTKQTAFVVYGLTDYLKASGELKPNFTVQVWLNDKQILSKSFTAADVFTVNPPSIRVPAAGLAGEENRIRIVKNGSGTVYWNTRADYYSTEERLTRNGSAKLNLLREYFTMVPTRVGEKIVYKLEPLAGPVKVGDIIAVRLVVSGDESRYLHIEDPIPAGTEFIERDDLYELQQKPSWWSRWFTRREFRDDRAVFFQTSFSRQTDHFYLLKVVNPGQFRASPARVQAMYQPQYFATTDSRALTVTP